MSATLPLLDAAAVAARRDRPLTPAQRGYFAMYAHDLAGIVTDPRLMLVPVDDHLVHRGDGVFETLKCAGGKLYNLAAHLDRLAHSAAQIRLAPPVDRAALTDLIVQTVRAGGRRDCLVRVLLSRGPGSLGVNPRDCPHPGLYVIAYAGHPPFLAAHPAGARLVTSHVPVKPSFLATIKTANYLPNALMKLEAAEAGADFAVNCDEAGHLAEGATENLALVARDGWLRLPNPDRILAGTTMNRVAELAAALVARGELRGVARADLTPADGYAAREVLIFGTTPDVAPVVEWDGRPIGDGRPGPIARALNALLAQDIRDNAARQTPVWD